MRRFVFALIVLGLVFAVSIPGLCQGISLDTIFASVEIPDSYTSLTPDNMETNADFLQKRGTAVDVMLQTFKAEGILLQAYGTSGDTCLQITALEDVDARNYFDIDQQTPTTRAKYRREHLDGDAYELLGISYDSAEWKKTTAYGRFLMLKYVQRLGGKVDHRGFARRTIRNGYTITIDYQVFGRGITAKDNNALNEIMDTWRFTKVLSKSGSENDSGSAIVAEDSGSAAAPANNGETQFAKKPPEQTNKATFTVEGTSTPGAQITGSVLRINTLNGIPVEATASKSGKFSFDVTLPQEGVYNLSLTVTVNGAVIQEPVFPAITYDKTMLPVRFDETFPDEIAQNKLTISGVTDSGVQIELNVNGEISTKKSNSRGEFSFTVDTAKEGTYTFALTFTKKGLVDYNVSFNAQRSISDSEEHAKIRADAIKPAHSTLTNKIKGYTGRIMGYTAYVKEIQKQESGDAWIVYLAFRQTKSGYRDIIVVTTKDEPPVMVDSQVKMYGRCTGMYPVLGDGDVTEEYPSFELLFWDN